MKKAADFLNFISPWNLRLQSFISLLLLSVFFTACDKQARDFVAGALPSAAIPGSGTSTSPISKPNVQWMISALSTNKSSAATINLTVLLSSPSQKTVIAPFILSGSAILNSDYSVTPTNSIAILPGQISAILNITVINDGSAGPTKNVVLTLDTPTNATLGNTQVQTFKIKNDL